jgi:hypothetical protein
MMIQFFYIFITLFIFSCHSSGYNSGKKTGEPTIKELIAAEDTIRLDGTQIVLKAYLWRDFMPISPPNGRPLQAVVTLLPVNSDYLPADIDVQKIWIIYQEELWSSPLSAVRPVAADQALTSLEKTADNGPKWEPGIEVTVVVQVIDKKGNIYLLKAEQQTIHRTV